MSNQNYSFYRQFFAWASMLLVLISCDSNSQKEFPLASSFEDAIDEMINEHVDSERIAGMVVGVQRNDTLLFLKPYGYADLEFDIPMPEDAIFEIGSVTKQFTSVAILQLMEEGKLSLDDPITDYIEFDTQEYTISIAQLMDHTSGIPSYTALPEFFGNLSFLDLPRDTLLRTVEANEFLFEPGTEMSYNNTAYFMLGLIIEKVSGISYEEYIQEKLFEPAGMKSSCYCDEQKILKKRAHGYEMGQDGLLRAEYLDHKWPYAAGSLCSTVEDLLKWNQVLHTTEVLLKKSSYHQMISTSKLNNAIPLRYAKGLEVYPQKGLLMIRHGGGINGFLADNRYFPDFNLSVVTLTNTQGPVGPSSASVKVAESLLEFGELETLPFEGSLEKYVGRYTANINGNTNTQLITTDGQHLLINQEGRDNKDTLLHGGEGIWRIGNEIFRFPEEGGKVKAMEVDIVTAYFVFEKE